jgi:HlyD family secretion protein
MDRKIEKKKWPPKKIAIVAASTLFVLFIAYGFIFGDKSSKLNVETERLTISTVERGAFQEFIPITGNVMPIRTIYLDAVQGGQVEELFLEAGSFVKHNDKILRLTNTNLLLDIMNREANLFEQRNNLRNTRLLMEQQRLTLKSNLAEMDFNILRLKRNYDRSRELVKKNLISQLEYEQVKDEYEYFIRRRELTLQSQRQDSLFRAIQVKQLEESVDRLQSNLAIVKQKLEDLVIKAPIAGQLTSLDAEIGQSISQGQRLGQIDVLDSFKVRAEIDEHYIARIEVGRTGSFDLADETYRLIVKKIYPEVREGRFETDLYFYEQAPEGIRRGQTLHIRLELGDLSEALLLPRGGFFQKTGGQWVYVLDGSGDVAIKRNIRIGRQNTQVYEVLEGLEPGEKVITSSYDSFGDNEKLVLK